MPNYSKYFILEPLSGNDEYGIQIVNSYLYKYIDKARGKMIYIGVCYRFNEHLCYLNLAWQQQHKEHLENDTTTFNKWLTKDYVTLHVILKKQFYVIA